MSFGGDNLDPLHQRSLQRNSTGASATSSPISDPPARRPSADGYRACALSEEMDEPQAGEQTGFMALKAVEPYEDRWETVLE
jgi:hypothetical protein